MESIDDYKEHFDFRCMANKVPEGWRKPFSRLELVGMLKILASPRLLNDLLLE